MSAELMKSNSSVDRPWSVLPSVASIISEVIAFDFSKILVVVWCVVLGLYGRSRGWLFDYTPSHAHYSGCRLSAVGTQYLVPVATWSGSAHYPVAL